nr:TolC family protein [uncultured Desulfuromonas sp.]
MTKIFFLKMVMFGLILGHFLCAELFAQNLSLQQCLQLGLSQNPEIRSYMLSHEEADVAIKEAWGEFLPTLSFEYRYNQLSNDSSKETDNDYLDQDSDSFSCRLTQPLFSGLSGVAGVKHARTFRDYRQQELNAILLQRTREIRTSFYEYLQASQRSEQWRASVGRLESQKEIATAWVEQELAPRLRLLETEVELSNARHELIRSEAEKAVAKARMRQWLALSPQEDFDLIGNFDRPETFCGASLESCIEQALQRRPELAAAQLDVELARLDKNKIMARNMPQAQLEASWTDYQRDYDTDQYNDDDRDYYSVSLNVTMRPFQGGKNYYAWRKQNVTIDRLTQRLAYQRHAIVNEVETRYQQLHEARARINNGQDALSAARAAYEVASRSAELGVVSLNDLLDSELRLTRAEISLIDSQAAWQLARVQLDYAVAGEVRQDAPF